MREATRHNYLTKTLEAQGRSPSLVSDLMSKYLHLVEKTDNGESAKSLQYIQLLQELEQGFVFHHA
jgi:hypothetical protein